MRISNYNNLSGRRTNVYGGCGYASLYTAGMAFADFSGDNNGRFPEPTSASGLSDQHRLTTVVDGQGSGDGIRNVDVHWPGASRNVYVITNQKGHMFITRTSTHGLTAFLVISVFIPFMFLISCSQQDDRSAPNTEASADQTAAAATLTSIRWVLHEINGQPVVSQEADANGAQDSGMGNHDDEAPDLLDRYPPRHFHAGQRPWFILLEEENRIEGFGGCNQFSGTYERTADNGITFSAMIATKMACPDVDINYETMLFVVFEEADRYDLHQNMMTLSRGSMAPIAVFRVSAEQ